jgi:putative transferase (TIGR04331 family)
MHSAEKRLIIGEIPFDYSPVNDIVLEIYSFKSRMEYLDLYPEVYVEDDAFKSTHKLKKAETVCNKYSMNIFSILQSQLNIKYNQSYSSRFWHVILFPWLLYIIQKIYEKEIRLKNVRKKYRNNKITVTLVSDNISWDFIDNYDFMNNGLFNSLFNEWLYSRIIEHDIPEKWSINYEDKSSQIHSSRISEPQKSWIKKYIIAVINNMKHSLSRVHDVYGFSIIDYLVFNFALKNKRVIKSWSKKLVEKTDFSDHVSSSSHIKPIYMSIITNSIPLSIVNNDVIRKKANYVLGKNKINIVSAMNITNNDNKLKYQLAQRYENGESIVVTQHGGHNYGSAKINSVPSIVEYKNHKFLTWGWNTQDNYHGNFVSLPSPMLSKIYNKHKCKNNTIYFVGNRMSLYYESYDSTPQPLQNLAYRDSKLIFLQSIDSGVKENILYRPYFDRHYCLKDGEYVKNKYKTIAICDPNKNNVYKFHKKIINSKILVVDHPGTTMMIALAANTPLICFWNPEQYSFNEQTELLLKDLHRVGIYFSLPIDAAKKINQVYSNVSLWWDSNELQSVRLKYLDNQGSVNEKWRSKWINYFMGTNYD